MCSRGLPALCSLASTHPLASPSPPPLRPSVPPAGDANTTADNLAALRAFFDKFPSMRGRPLFLAGQGYAGASHAGQPRHASLSALPGRPSPLLPARRRAGHTVPQLAQEIRRRNDRAQAPGDRIQLRGMLVGNPWVEPELDNRGAGAATAAVCCCRCMLAAAAAAARWHAPSARRRSRRCFRAVPCRSLPAPTPPLAAAVAFWYDNGLISGASHADLLASCDMKHIGAPRRCDRCMQPAGEPSSPRAWQPKGGRSHLLFGTHVPCPPRSSVAHRGLRQPDGRVRGRAHGGTAGGVSS